MPDVSTVPHLCPVHPFRFDSGTGILRSLGGIPSQVRIIRELSLLREDYFTIFVFLKKVPLGRERTRFGRRISPEWLLRGQDAGRDGSCNHRTCRYQKSYVLCLKKVFFTICSIYQLFLLVCTKFYTYLYAIENYFLVWKTRDFQKLQQFSSMLTDNNQKTSTFSSQTPAETNRTQLKHANTEKIISRIITNGRCYIATVRISKVYELLFNILLTFQLLKSIQLVIT